jgi:RimJ/RimL family protein N-acetyltransferase
MDTISTAFATAFKTERLVFRAIEDKDSHRAWMWKHLWSNPVSTGLSSPNVFLPPSERSFKKDFERLVGNTFIAAFVCLPKPAGTGGGEAESPEKDNKDQEEEKKKKEDEDSDVTFIGMICLSKFGADAFKRRTAIGIQLADEHQNKGYGREVLNWALDWAFTFGDMHRVDIGTVSYNERAVHLYEDMGFKREGVKRDVLFMNRQWHSMIDFGMLVHEWEELRGLGKEQQEVPVRAK